MITFIFAIYILFILSGCGSLMYLIYSNITEYEQDMKKRKEED